jgi:hypothetical protein|tara:strand:- start:194 stop:361 length:168 start_codon:yes stop_codon:yes gene_type:complete
MSKRNGRNKIKLSYLDEINKIDKRLKRKKVRDNDSEKSKLISRRDTLRQKLKTKK